MTITKWQPFSDLLGVYDRINRLFEEEYLPEMKSARLGVSVWHPLTDIFETKDSYVFKMELPGFSKNDIKIELVNDVLTVKGERKQEEEYQKEDVHRIERSYGAFQRTFSIPKNVDPKKIEASLKDGLLMLTILKVDEAKTKAIPISVK